MDLREEHIIVKGKRMQVLSIETESERPYIVQHDAHKHVEWYPEEVDDGGSALLWHVLAAHLHHAGPEQPNTGLKDTEGQQLHLACQVDACKTGNISVLRDQTWTDLATATIVKPAAASFIWAHADLLGIWGICLQLCLL